jgi:single-stranded-DNA-specific exonuclease
MRWQPRSLPDEASLARLSAELRLTPVITRLLAMRGIATPDEAQAFLFPSFHHLHSPYDMLGMSAAVERICAAVERKEKALIYGDYDADGTIAIVILKTAMELCGGACEFHVPHRLREGYGMRDDVIERAAAEGVRLIISVDTGIRAFAAAETAGRLGLDLIVTDHHLPQSGDLPRAFAVLNPNQPGCRYPCKALCGAGVAFKLAQALMEKRGKTELLPSFLKVVAIATVADAVPLVGENRVFAKLGLEGLRKPVNLGLKALMEVAQVAGGRALTSGEVAFRLAPRLNAAGRMDVAGDVINLFSSRDPAKAREIAEHLNRLNLERQQEEKRILEEAEVRIAADTALHDSWCMVVDGEGWHKGVIGIAATRLVERYCRPVLVLTRDGAEAQGSARSIESFHMLAALESCAHLFTRLGGHAHAAGFALPSERIPDLRIAVEQRARECLSREDLEPTLTYDSELALDEITAEFWAQLCQMGPFGVGNPEPVFVARRLRLLAAPRLVTDKHLKLRVGQLDSPLPNGAAPRAFDALGWRMADRVASLAPQEVLDLAFNIVDNHHPEFGGLQLSLCDFAKSAIIHSAVASDSSSTDQ